MKNLAGVKDCDVTIKEELYLAGIKNYPAPEHTSEVPYSIFGKVGNWRFRRAWYYWVVTVEETTDGLPVEKALELYNTENPANGEKLGVDVRAGGDGGGISPDGYVAQPVYDDELNDKLVALGYEKKYHKIQDEEHVEINMGEMADLCKSGKLDVQRYVRSYHIDTQVGLNEFVRFLWSKENADIDKKIKKYEGILNTLKENRSNAVEGDQYDYENDIKNCAEFIRDLKSLKKN